MKLTMRLGLVAVLMMVVGITLSGAGTLAAPASQAAWSAPVNISRSPWYDTAPGIAAAPSGAVSIAWERRQTSNPTANFILQVTSPAPGGAFTQGQLSHTEPQKTSGSVRIRHDALGRKHLVWWQYEGNNVCDYYARLEADGRVSVVEQVPGSCGQTYKNTALAIGPDNSAHILFGRNLQNLFYWQRNDSGWVVQAEKIPATNAPEHPVIGVTTMGAVIIAWQDSASKGNTDIYSATRAAANKWSVEDISASLSPGCPGTSSTYLPSLAGDPFGGMRAVWADEQCDPRNVDPPWRDMYYREWTPDRGWGASSPVRIARTTGTAGANDIVVDATGLAHIVWVVTYRVTDIKIYYASGRGTSFSAPVAPFAAWANGEDAKDVALDYSPGFIHLAFASTREDPQKDVYYSYLRVAGTPSPPPAPTVTPRPAPPGISIPGAGSRTFPETKQTTTGIFLDYWNAHGALAQQGFPISGLLREVSELNGKQYIVQYFQRAVMEYHPEYLAPNNILLSQLGTYRYHRKYPNGAPGQQANTQNAFFFKETGHWLGGRFLEYWQQNGGLAQQGYPISDEFTEVSDTDGRAYRVQYFERAVFEWHPENQRPYDVLLSLLGSFQYKAKYGGR